MVVRILDSPIEGQDNRVIYHALQIASRSIKFDSVIEGMVLRILNERDNTSKQHYLYLQMMKVPLFRVRLWQDEVKRALLTGVHIHRNLLFSLTKSHINNPDPLSDTCLLIIKNWAQEFKAKRKFWGYFIRSLAHPIIQREPELLSEIRQLCLQMFIADNCPSQIKSFVQSIAEGNEFPLWKTTECQGLVSKLEL